MESQPVNHFIIKFQWHGCFWNISAKESLPSLNKVNSNYPVTLCFCVDWEYCTMTKTCVLIFFAVVPTWQNNSWAIDVDFWYCWCSYMKPLYLNGCISWKISLVKRFEGFFYLIYTRRSREWTQFWNWSMGSNIDQSTLRSKLLHTHTIQTFIHNNVQSHWYSSMKSFIIFIFCVSVLLLAVMWLLLYLLDPLLFLKWVYGMEPK